jgi:hypothetical protein
MIINYEKLKSYYENGLLGEILTKLNLKAEDFAEALFAHIGVLEAEIADYDKGAVEDSVALEELEYEIRELKEQLEALGSDSEG